MAALTCAAEVIAAHCSHTRANHTDIPTLRLTVVANGSNEPNNPVSKKQKLLFKLRSRPKDMTWDEAKTLLSKCGFEDVSSGGGAGRMFVHAKTRIKLRLHEPHPNNTLLPYMVKELFNALNDAGELSDED